MIKNSTIAILNFLQELPSGSSYALRR